MFRASTYSTFVALALACATAYAGVGSVSLVDQSGLNYFINDDLTFTTSSNASGAASDATFNAAVAATTSGGGTSAAVLGNAFDGYNALFVNGVPFNMNGASVADADCANNGQVIFETQTIGNFSVFRKVYVPDDDEFCRWLNVITNTSGATQQAIVTIVNNLGSDGDTVVVATSNPPAVATISDEWVVTFEDYTAGSSPSPRLGHVLQGPNRKQSLTDISFVDGDDKPFWEFTLSIPGGATYILMNFVTGQPGKQDAIDQCTALVGLPDTAFTCMTDTELTQVMNFDMVAPTVSMSTTAANPTNDDTIPVTVTFSESVTGFDAGDIIPSNATVDDFAGSGASYTFDLVPLSDGAVSADIAAAAAQDLAGNFSLEADTFTHTVDSFGPSVVMTSTSPNPTTIVSVVQVTITFSEAVSNFTQSDISTVNCVINTFSGAGTTYKVGIAPRRVFGPMGIDIDAGVATDAAGNENTAAASFRVQVQSVLSCFNTVTKGTSPKESLAGMTELIPLALAAAIARLVRRKRCQPNLESK